MGTPEFAVTSLAKILETEHTVVGVITAPDKPAGRGRKITISEVKQFALKKELPIYQPSNLKSEKFLAELREMNPDVIVVVAFRMLPKQVWNFPKFGTFNVHASLLPNYRGAAPIHWAIVNGEKTTGVTTFFLNEEIDMGEIILQKKLAIGKDETLGDIYPKLETLGAESLIETLELISLGIAEAKPQPIMNQIKQAPKLTKDNTAINWAESVTIIHNKIRGLSPFPAAWSTIVNNKETKRCKLYKAHIHSNKIEAKIGSIIKNKKNLLVQAKDGVLVIDEIKIEGKKKMSAVDFLNGYSLLESAYFI